MRLALAAIAGLLLAGAAHAQGSWSSYTVGPYTNYAGRTEDGQPFFLVESQVGPVRNLQGHIGGRQVYCTSFELGPYAQTKCH